MDDKIYNQIANIQNLNTAWNTVKAKGKSGGIDLVSVGMFDADADGNLMQLHHELKSQQYTPEPYKHYQLHVNGADARPIGLMTVKDKIVQVAVKNIIEPEIESRFFPCSYAYRKNKNTLMAIRQIVRFAGDDNLKWLAVCDIDKFFDTIPHDLLLDKLSRKIQSQATMELISCWIKMGDINADRSWTERNAGVPQGAILSPLLSNFYLHPLDGLMMKQKAGFVRYADDFVILARHKIDAQKVADTAKWFITKKLMLALNDEPHVKHISEGFEFLGVSFKNNEVFLSGEKLKNLGQSLEREFIVTDTGIVNPMFHTVCQNIRNYYGKVLPENVLETIDSTFINMVAHKIFLARKNKTILSDKAFMHVMSGIRYFSSRYNMERVELSENMLQKCKVALKNDLDQVTLFDKLPEVKPLVYQTNQPGEPPPQQDAVKIVARKRREYEKLESAGMELIVSTPGIFAGINQNRIILKKAGKVIHSMPRSNLKNISIISQGVALSSNLVLHCAQHDIAIHFLNYDGSPYAQFISPAFIHAKTGLAQLESLHNGIAQNFVKASVSAKMKNQINLIKYYHKYRKNTDPDFAALFDNKIHALSKLQSSIKHLPHEDIEAFRKSVFAIEGQTAAIYWSLIKTLIDDYIDFPGRQHQDAKLLLSR